MSHVQTRTTRVSRGTSGGVRASLRQNMFIHVPRMGAVKVPVMQIVDVTIVLDRRVPAAWAMRMRVLIVCFVIAHLVVSFGSRVLDRTP